MYKWSSPVQDTLSSKPWHATSTYMRTTPSQIQMKLRTLLHCFLLHRMVCKRCWQLHCQIVHRCMPLISILVCMTSLEKNLISVVNSRAICWTVNNFSYFFFLFPCQWCVEVPGLGIRSEPLLWPIPQLWQYWIFNSWCGCGSNPHPYRDNAGSLTCCATVGIP